MSNGRDSWRQTATALGEALIEVLRAELAVIAEAWKKSARELAVFLGVLAVAGYVALVCLPALLIFAAVTGLHVGLGWPLWGSALTVAAAVALLVSVAVWIALKRLQKKGENPVATVRDRFADHVAWWQDSILRDDRTLGETDGVEDGPQGRQGNDAGIGSTGETPRGS